LEKIARNNGTTVDAIKKANHLTTAKLSIGQVLRVPTGEIKPSTVNQLSKETEMKASNFEAQYYTIKSGDNPWKIAKQFNVKFEDLLHLNHLDEESARNLKVGDKVRVK
jgi:LysM repeat protein